MGIGIVEEPLAGRRELRQRMDDPLEPELRNRQTVLDLGECCALRARDELERSRTAILRSTGREIERPNE